jgi:hypothetical protein
VRQFVAYLPTAAVVSVLWLVIAFELTPLKYINPVFGIILGSPVIYVSTVIPISCFFFLFKCEFSFFALVLSFLNVKKKK